MQPTNKHPLGNIVKSNTHTDYVCQIYNPGERAGGQAPTPQEYALGTFVSIAIGNAEAGSSANRAEIIGIVYDTVLMNPDYGRLGPRLSPRSELEIVAPDYIEETATLVGLFAIGWRDEQKQFHQGIPTLAAPINGRVYGLSSDDVRLFHSSGADGQPRLGYASWLMAQSNPLIQPLLLTILDRLGTLFPDSTRQLAVMRTTIAWKTVVQPAG